MRSGWSRASGSHGLFEAARARRASALHRGPPWVLLRSLAVARLLDPRAKCEADELDSPTAKSKKGMCGGEGLYKAATRGRREGVGDMLHKRRARVEGPN